MLSQSTNIAPDFFKSLEGNDEYEEEKPEIMNIRNLLRR